jgi:hypothetical protein
LRIYFGLPLITDALAGTAIRDSIRESHCHHCNAFVSSYLPRLAELTVNDRVAPQSLARLSRANKVEPKHPRSTVLSNLQIYLASHLHWLRNTASLLRLEKREQLF